MSAHTYLPAVNGADVCRACGNPRAYAAHDTGTAIGNLVPLYRQPDAVRAARLRRFVGQRVRLTVEPFRSDYRRGTIAGLLVAAPSCTWGSSPTLAVLRLDNGGEYAWSSAQIREIVGE